MRPDGSPAEDYSLLAFARERIAQRIAKLDGELGRARSDRSEDAVHDLRVAARRLLSTIDCFRSALWDKGTKTLRKRAKAVLRSGRHVREVDIALGLAADAGVDPQSALAATLGRERAEAAVALGALVKRKRFRKFAEKWLPRLGEGGPGGGASGERDKASVRSKHPDWAAGGSCAANARRVLPRMASEFFAIGRGICAGDPSLAELHRLRLAGKRLRYCLELFRKFYRREMRGRLRSLRRIQRLLGAVSDCDATGSLIRARGLEQDREAEILLASLGARNRASADAFLEHWRAQFDAPGQEREWMEFLRTGLR